jgi:prevent-host-death family protein
MNAPDGKVMSVGIRELKNRLSHYLGKVKAGDRIAVTDRGEIVAYVLPAGADPGLLGLLRLVREDRASWNGGKPAGLPRPESAKGKSVSAVVIEDRR